MVGLAINMPKFKVLNLIIFYTRIWFDWRNSPIIRLLVTMVLIAASSYNDGKKNLFVIYANNPIFAGADAGTTYRV